MATPGTMLDDLEALNLGEIVEDAIQEKKQNYLKVNLDQLYEGLNSDGQKIQPKYRSQKYAKAKAEMNPLPGEGTPDFYLTGELYRQSTIEVEGGDLVEQSGVPYAKDLEDRWGEDQIWGLDDENHDQWVNEELRDAILERVSELTGIT